MSHHPEKFVLSGYSRTYKYSNGHRQGTSHRRRQGQLAFCVMAKRPHHCEIGTTSDGLEHGHEGLHDAVPRGGGVCDHGAYIVYVQL